MSNQPKLPDDSSILCLDAIEAEGLEAANQRAKAFLARVDRNSGTIPPELMRQLDRVTAQLVLRELAREVRGSATGSLKQPAPLRTSAKADRRHPASVARTRGAPKTTLPRIKLGWSKQRVRKASYLMEAFWIGSLTGAAAFAVAIFVFAFLNR